MGPARKPYLLDKHRSAVPHVLHSKRTLLEIKDVCAGDRLHLFIQEVVQEIAGGICKSTLTEIIINGKLYFKTAGDR